eukprot:g2140.t1
MGNTVPRAECTCTRHRRAWNLCPIYPIHKTGRKTYNVNTDEPKKVIDFKPSVICLCRRPGDVICRHETQELLDRRDKIEEAGFELIFVLKSSCNGVDLKDFPPFKGTAFKENSIFISSENDLIFKALGHHQASILNYFNLCVLLDYRRAYKKGFKHKDFNGEELLLGGISVYVPYRSREFRLGYSIVSAKRLDELMNVLEQFQKIHMKAKKSMKNHEHHVIQ